MPEPQLLMSAQSFFGIAPETVRGTAVTPASLWIPVDSPQATPDVTWLPDGDWRGSPAMTYDQVAGVRHDEYDFKGNVHLDTFPALLVAALGGPDAVTGSTTFTHTIPLLNNAAVGSQPKSYTLYDFNGGTTKQIAGGQLSTLELDFTATDAFKFSTKFLGQPFGTVSNPTTEAYTGVDRLIPAWSNALTIAGAANTLLVDGSITIDRSSVAVHVAGQQNPAVSFAGPIKVTGKLTFLVPTTDAITPTALASTQQAVTMTFTDPSSSHTLLAQMSKVQFMNPTEDRGDIYVKVNVDFEAIANSTDAASGFSPIKFVVVNAASTTY